MVKLEQVNVVVGDMSATADFYERLGVSFRPSSPEWALHHRNTGGEQGVDFDLDSELFAPSWNNGWRGGSGIVLGFRFDNRADVDRVHGELVAAGYPSQQEPYDAFWGVRYAVVTDPEGYAVALMSPVDEALRTASPAPPRT